MLKKLFETFEKGGEMGDFAYAKSILYGDDTHNDQVSSKKGYKIGFNCSIWL